MKLKSSPAPDLLLAALGLMSGTAMAAVTDATGDWAPSYTLAKTSDLDVVSAFLSYDPNTHMFTASGTMAGTIGQSVGAFYVWGIQRGSGTSGAFVDAPGVKFDTTIILNQNGTGTVAGAALAAGVVTINGSTISATFAESMLPNTTAGISFGGYTWNLWPRFNNQVPDFAPNNAMAAVDVVPEPGTWAMMGLGLLALSQLRRRR